MFCGRLGSCSYDFRVFLLRLGMSGVVDIFGGFCYSADFPVFFLLGVVGLMKIVLQYFGLSLVDVFKHT